MHDLTHIQKVNLEYASEALGLPVAQLQHEDDDWIAFNNLIASKPIKTVDFEVL